MIYHFKKRETMDTVSKTYEMLSQDSTTNSLSREDFLVFTTKELERRQKLRRIYPPFLEPIMFIRQDHTCSPEYLKELRLCMGLPLTAMAHVVNFACDFMGHYEKDHDILLSPSLRKRIEAVGKEYAETGVRPEIDMSKKPSRAAKYGPGFHKLRKKQEAERIKSKSHISEKSIKDFTKDGNWSVLPTTTYHPQRSKAIKEESKERAQEYHTRNELTNDYSKVRTFMETPLVYVLFGVACYAVGACSVIIINAFYR